MFVFQQINIKTDSNISRVHVCSVCVCVCVCVRVRTCVRVRVYMMTTNYASGLILLWQRHIL